MSGWSRVGEKWGGRAYGARFLIEGMVPKIKAVVTIVWTELLNLTLDTQGPFSGFDQNRLKIVR
jgi:hypothetical protein